MMTVLLLGNAATDTFGQAKTDTFGQAKLYMKARCDQLTAYYDYYGVSLVQNSDGSRSLIRVGAGIDCGRGEYEAGLRTIEDLLTARAFVIPQPQQASTPDGRVAPIISVPGVPVAGAMARGVSSRAPELVGFRAPIAR
jgi:hypothetical protein